MEKLKRHTLGLKAAEGMLCYLEEQGAICYGHSFLHHLHDEAT